MYAFCWPYLSRDCHIAVVNCSRHRTCVPSSLHCKMFGCPFIRSYVILGRLSCRQLCCQVISVQLDDSQEALYAVLSFVLGLGLTSVSRGRFKPWVMFYLWLDLPHRSLISHHCSGDWLIYLEPPKTCGSSSLIIALDQYCLPWMK